MGARLLDRFGYQVLMAGDGAEAVQLLRLHANEVRAVLLDLTMPGMSGEETFRRIRDLRPGGPVVLSSGFTRTEVASRFHGEGPSAFVRKPYEPLHLIRVLQGVLDDEHPGTRTAAEWPA